MEQISLITQYITSIVIMVISGYFVIGIFVQSVGDSYVKFYDKLRRKSQKEKPNEIKD